MRKFIILAVSVAICGLFYVSASFATTYYVAPNANGDGSSGKPMNIEKAFTKAVAGDVVNIKGGLYKNVHPVVANSGSGSKRITFQAWASTGKPILMGKGAGSGYGILARGKSRITIKGIRVTNYEYGIYLTNDGQYKNGCHYAIIDGCEADSSFVAKDKGADGYGIMIQDGDHCIIRNCTAVDNDGDNIFLSRSRYSLIEKCTVKCKQKYNLGYATDYYCVLAWCSYDTVRNCYAEDVTGSGKGNHGFIIKDTEKASAQGDETHSTGNFITGCTAKNLEECFCVAHQAYGNRVYNCSADNTKKRSSFDHCLMVRDGAYKNTFSHCTAVGYQAVVGVYDGSVEGGNDQMQTGNTFANCTFKNGQLGIFLRSAVNTTFRNCTFVNITSLFRFSKTKKGSNVDDNSGTVITNCILSGVTNRYETLKRTNGWGFYDTNAQNKYTTESGYDDMKDVSFTYSDLFGGFDPDEVSGKNNFDKDPKFADSSYHLMSTVGRWDGSKWVKDASYSPCIDAGTGTCKYELAPNGGKINLGRWGNTKWASKSKVNSKIVGEDEAEVEAPMEFALSQNVPNPFNPSTMISYTVAAEGMVTVKVYSANGQLVDTLVDEVKTPGSYNVTWAPKGLASGMYFCKLQSGSFSKTTKMIFMK